MTREARRTVSIFLLGALIGGLIVGFAAKSNSSAYEPCEPVRARDPFTQMRAVAGSVGLEGAEKLNDQTRYLEIKLMADCRGAVEAELKDRRIEEPYNGAVLTQNLGLHLPELGQQRWADDLNFNYEVIDDVLALCIERRK